MVTYKVVVTPNAQRSIRRIHDRLLNQASRDVAVKVRRGINEAIKSLKSFPESHEEEHILNEDSQDQYRRILQWNYRIIYVIDEDTQMVSVVEVVHNTMSEQAIQRKLDK